MTKARAFTILTRATSSPSKPSTFTSSPLPPSTSSRKSPSKSVDLGGENLTFYAGTCYLGGSVAGAAAGVISGVKSFEYGDTTKLKINRILNSSGHTGRSLGCRIGAAGLIYAGIESGVVAYTDRDDVWTSVVAGLGTGAVFRAARGVRSAAVAGALGGMVAGGVVAGKQVLKRYAHI
ncbi:hypothetical protein Bca4012_070848 [Brassica carinata]|uniref:BnaC05g13650D protein n=4 Tax=Brassica TaxID=3705 RepID=A0A078IE79_BRANA|nr:hypothetical protein HID58_065151 [Brassica napus]CAF1926425.1 unnamed protein product [Brassica napus]CDY48311.1 BnaC05g13650D [Brassica napus]VDD42751.1 unnamed protein product [Brassica oleracea]